MSMEKALSILNEGLEKEKDKRVPVDHIIEYFINKAKNEQGFAERIVLANKTLKECFEYVYQEVRKRISGPCGWLDDDVVYKIAETYYILDEVEIKKPEVPKPKVSTPKTTPVTPVAVKPMPTKSKNNLQQISLFEL